MKRISGVLCAVLGLLALVNLVVPGGGGFGFGGPAEAQALPVQTPPEVDAVLRTGVLIVISKATQQMYVFKDGALWASSPVSTGKRGHSTPAGIFPILQKRVHHRSNLYSNAPMPYMQRLTWRGVAIHAGHLPGYPASHGCIRLPYGFARSLFGLTSAASTTVVVTNEVVRSDEMAVTVALNAQRAKPVVPAIIREAPEALASVPAPSQASAPGQTIQLAATPSAGEADMRWSALVAAYPDLAGFKKSVVPAMVGQRQYFRLRASAPGAHAYCSALKRAGQDCFRVV